MSQLSEFEGSPEEGSPSALLEGFESNFAPKGEPDEGKSEHDLLKAGLSHDKIPSNPGPGLLDKLPGGQGAGLATATGITEVHKQTFGAFNQVADALRGGPSGNSIPMGSSTMPKEWYRSTPTVSLNVNGQNISLGMPKVEGGKTVDYSRNKVDKGFQIEARSGRDRWLLQQNFWLLGSNWSWEKQAR